MTRYLKEMKNEDWLRLLMKKPGLAVSGGICFGTAMLGINFMLTNKVTQFDAILNNCFKLADKEASKCLSSIEKNQITNFLQDISAYQTNLKHIPVHRSRFSNLGLITQIYSPTLFKDSNENNTQLRLINMQDNKFNLIDNEYLFTSFRAMISKTNRTTPVAMLISARKHAAALWFNSNNNKWELINSTTLPSISFDTEADLIKKLICIFYKDDRPQDMPIKIRPFTNQQYFEYTQQVVSGWLKKLPDKCKYNIASNETATTQRLSLATV